MNLMGFPHCCTAQILLNFGESGTAEGGDFKTSVEKMRRNISMQIDYNIDEGFAMVVATTNNEQKTANRVLKEMGFSCSEWMFKAHHPETKVRLWWLNVAKYFGEFDLLKAQHKKFRK